MLVQHRLSTQLEVLLQRDPLAREDLPEGVHTMRVAARRLRSALATCRPFLDRSVTDPLRDDSAGSRTRSARPEMPRCGGSGSTPPSTHWPRSALTSTGTRAACGPPCGPRSSTGTAARAQLDEVFASERYAALLDRLRALVAAPPWTDRAAKNIGGAYRRRVERSSGRLRRRMAAADEPDLTSDERAHALHEARKAVKRARYATEPLRPVHGSNAVAMVKRLKKLPVGARSAPGHRGHPRIPPRPGR